MSIGKASESPFDVPIVHGQDDAMEHRIEKLEQFAERTDARLSNIERDLAVVRSNYATKQDIEGLRAELHKELHAQTWRMIGLMLTVALGLAGMMAKGFHWFGL